MAKQLSKEAIEILSNNEGLQIAVAAEMKVSIHSMPMSIRRNNSRFIEYPVVTIIASFMNKTPDEIIEDTEEKIEQ